MSIEKTTPRPGAPPVNESPHAQQEGDGRGRLFDSLASRYGEGECRSFYGRIAHSLLDLASQTLEVPPAQILEVGCGTGIATRLLASRFPNSDIVASDSSPAMLERLRRGPVPDCGERVHPLLMHAGVLGEHFSQREPFNLVFANMSAHWLRSADLASLARCLRPSPDGLAALSIPLSTPYSTSSGNRLLMRTLLQLRRRRSVTTGGARAECLPQSGEESGGGRTGVNSKGKPVNRSPGLLMEALPAFMSPMEILHLGKMEIEERYRSFSHLAKVLWSRGSFHAIFGAEALRAREMVEQRVCNGSAVQMSWQIALVLGIVPHYTPD